MSHCDRPLDAPVAASHAHATHVVALYTAVCSQKGCSGPQLIFRYLAGDSNRHCCTAECGAGPYANKVWGPAPKDGSFETITPAELQQAKEDAKVSHTAIRP